MFMVSIVYLSLKNVCIVEHVVPPVFDNGILLNTNLFYIKPCTALHRYKGIKPCILNTQYQLGSTGSDVTGAATSKDQKSENIFPWFCVIVCDIVSLLATAQPLVKQSSTSKQLVIGTVYLG